MLSPRYILIIIASVSNLGLMIIAPSIALGMNLKIEEKIDINDHKTIINVMPTISSPTLNSLNEVKPANTFELVSSFDLSTSTGMLSRDIQPSLTSSSSLIQYNIKAESQPKWEQELIRSQTEDLKDFYPQNSNSSQGFSATDEDILEVPEPDLIIGLELIGLGLLGVVLRNLT